MLRRGDVAGVLRLLRDDYARQYFVTAAVTDEIYDEDCLYADPTISFRGRERYKRNLSLLVPFFWDAAIQLRSLKRLPPASPPPSSSSSSKSGRGGKSSSGGGTSSIARSSGRGGRGSSSGGWGSSKRAALSEQAAQQQQQQLTWWQRLPGFLAAQGGERGQAPVQLLAEWRLTCWLRLPWAPCVAINGTTTYTLNEDSNQVVSHVEAWDVSAGQALLLLLRPSDRAMWRR